MQSMKVCRNGLLSLTVALLAGCGGSGLPKVEGTPEEATLRNQLIQVGELVTGFAKSHDKKGPAKLSDLQQYEKINPAGFQAIKDNAVVLIYGVSPDSSSSAVLAYQKDADKNGGMALLANGTLKKVSAGDVAASIKK
jgi:hypothetical protein